MLLMNGDWVITQQRIQWPHWREIVGKMGIRGNINNMKKVFLMILFLPSLVVANTQTHNIYAHKTGIDTSIYSQPQVQPDFSQLNGLAKKVRQKREAKKATERQSTYSLDLIDATDGLKNINTDTIRPLIQKYPEKSDELLRLLKEAN